MTFKESNHPALYYQDMLSDRVRNARYRRAIAAAVRPGDVVADLGTGLGVLAIMAVQAGAAHVYAVDVRPHVLPIAQRVLEANGVADRVTLIAGDATTVELPRAVNVIVNELIGDFGTDENIHECVAAVAAKHLLPGGLVVPARLSTHIAGVSYAGEFRGVFSDAFDGLDLRAAVSDPFQSTPVMYGLRHRPEELTAVATVEDIVFGSTMPPRAYEYPIELRVMRAGSLQGFTGFFRCELAPGVLLDNYPCYPGCHWVNWHWPVTPAVDVEPGQTIRGVLTTPERTVASCWTLDWCIA